MSLTPGLTLVGLLVFLIAIPLGLAFGPRFWFMWDDLCLGAIGAIVLVYAARRAHDELAEGPATLPA